MTVTLVRRSTSRERISVEFVSAPYFSLLGVAPGARPHVSPLRRIVVATPAVVVILSDGLWKRRFGADPQIVGRSGHAERARRTPSSA